MVIKLRLETQIYYLKQHFKLSYMRKFVTLFLLFFGLIQSIFAQVNVKGDPLITDFPNIEFTINTRNPNIIDASSFIFSEVIDGQTIKSDSFDIKQIKDTVDFSKKNKCVLILLETLVHKDRVEQNQTFYSALTEVLDDVVKKGDQFKIVTFSLKDESTNILHDVNSDFTDSISVLKTSLNDHVTKENAFTNKAVSDIYGAIIEAVGQLDDFSSTLPKSIFLLSEERHNQRITDVRSSAIYLAKEKGIVINTIKYNRSRYEQHADPTLAEHTYGINKILSISSGDLGYINEDKKNEVKEFIKSTLNNAAKRASGINYTVSLKLNNRIKDGEKHVIEIKVDDTTEVHKFSYKAPGNWVVAQFQLHLYIASAVSFLLVLLLGFLIYYLVKKHKLKASEKSNRIKQQQEKEAQQQKEISDQKEELSNIKLQQEKRKDIESDKLRKDNESQLLKQMLLKGSFPILKFTDSTGSTKYEINKPIITVGRDKGSNSICIANNNISRNHFSIVFENNGYKVIDNNSTNGIILNGSKIKESVLDNADIIEIADISFTFFK